MYDFHYNYIRQKYNNRAKLLYTDTNSLCYEIENGDAYKDFWVIKRSLIIVIMLKIAHIFA